MTCEEFATAGLDLDYAGVDSELQKAAREHLRECPHCAAFHENWLTLREDLRDLGAESAHAVTPQCVEMRLREEFVAKHKAVRKRHGVMIVGWGLAAAATLFLAFTGMRWHRHRGPDVAQTGSSVTLSSLKGGAANSSKVTNASDSELAAVLVASNDAGGFTLLPDSMPTALEDTTVVRVRMQRAALGAFGLTVNEEHAGDWIQVDLLVSNDGLPQAVRLPATNAETSN
jgi:predicted anti-sigma-YlaC factor YlaD